MFCLSTSLKNVYEPIITLYFLNNKSTSVQQSIRAKLRGKKGQKIKKNVHAK